jgi:DNA polymerase elongation subunit (family B)
MYQEIGNSIYGSVVRGMSNKLNFDTKTQTTQRMKGDDLSNPLIASWTTAFIRSIIGECLHGINKRGGKVVSVTTDGFITNLENLESLIECNFLLKEFKSIRFNLSNDNSGLELKSFGKGVFFLIYAWSIRS